MTTIYFGGFISLNVEKERKTEAARDKQAQLLRLIPSDVKRNSWSCLTQDFALER